MILRRIWHFLAGHPTPDLWHVLEGGMECQSCGKRGARL